MVQIYDNNSVVCAGGGVRSIADIQSASYISLTALAARIVSKVLQAASSYSDAIYANNGQDRLMNLTNFRNNVGNFIDEPGFVKLILQQEIEEPIKDQVSILQTMPIRFRLSIPLDDILLLSSMAKYYTMIKTDLMASGPDKLKNIDQLFKNWMTQSIKNYVVTEAAANMSGYKITDDCLQRVREFYANRPFVVPSQRVEAWSFPKSTMSTGIRTQQNIPLSHVTDLCLLFPKDARATTCSENPCYHNIILDLSFQAIDEFEDALKTSRNMASRRLNIHTDLTSFMIALQCKHNSNGALTFDGLDTQNQNMSVEL
ncbi:MAG: hypothetical protein EZS28_000275 [Streblomastix strix]|uniref:Uncharacterized protein n=1 Tax=Streblomastix strix TaxID=222440 RepID=A0A5J4XB91_9EUKA|nr:MAG: hypothetical protein EZS28_000275 [Streblomastix strix]